MSILNRTWDYIDLARQSFKLRGGDERVRDAARAHLAARMGRLRGLPQKIGQILSMNAIDGDADPFAPLTNAADPLQFDVIAPLLESAWRKPIGEVVSYVDRAGLAASLGQVHRATLRDGRQVAIKVRFPGIRDAVMADLSVLGWLAAPVKLVRGGFDLADYRAAILRDIEEELDYRVEAMHQTRYAAIAAELGGWAIPRVIAELSNDSVLVTEWLDSKPVDTAAAWPIEHRRTLAKSYLSGLLHALFHHGFVHADPHPGNVRYCCTPTPRIALFDFGSIAKLTPPRRLALLELIDMTASRCGDPLGPLLDLGFNPDLLRPMHAKLPALCAVLFEPFTLPGAFSLSQWRRGERIADILGDDRWNFRMSGPAELVFVLRVFSGICFHLSRLGVDVCWSSLIRPHLDAARAAITKRAAARAAERCSNAAASAGFEHLAQHLRVRVSRAGKTHVALSFPAIAVDELESLMDAELQDRIARAGYDVKKLSRAARQNGYAPQTIFDLAETETERGVKVWLE